MAPRTLYDKVFGRHVVDENNGLALLYIDRHLIHEVTSPQAFEGLRNAGRQVRRPECTLATADHKVPTTSRNDFESVDSFIEEEESRIQVLTMERNAAEYGVQYFGLGDKRQGIVHVIGPEQGFTLPGTTVVCGDSHTSTPALMGPSALWHLGLVQAKWNMCLLPKPFARCAARTCKSKSTATSYLAPVVRISFFTSSDSSALPEELAPSWSFAAVQFEL
ncbi:unnamed protein product [Penicillium olsonii]|nr:unnamed protein product [Penicillium olsonii]